MVWILNGTPTIWNPTIWNPDKRPPFCQKPFEIQTKMSGFWIVQFSNDWDSSHSHTTKARPFENQTIFEIWPSKSLDFKCFWISNGRISDPHCMCLNTELFRPKKLLKSWAFDETLSFQLSKNCPQAKLANQDLHFLALVERANPSWTRIGLHVLTSGSGTGLRGTWLSSAASSSSSIWKSKQSGLRFTKLLSQF